MAQLFDVVTAVAVLALLWFAVPLVMAPVVLLMAVLSPGTSRPTTDRHSIDRDRTDLPRPNQPTAEAGPTTKPLDVHRVSTQHPAPQPIVDRAPQRRLAA